MKRAIFLIIAAIFSGCCATAPPDIPYTLPQLVEQTPLPAIRAKTLSMLFELDLRMLIGEDGSVRMVELLNSSGDRNWDTLATARIKEWKFSPARYNNQAIRLWIRQRITVKSAEPMLMMLAEIILPSRQIADSVYALLQNGGDFSTLARQFSITNSRENGGFLGEVDVFQYPIKVSDHLKNLSPGGYSAPIELGFRYGIFRRVVIGKVDS
jgi:TonB family protein